jgi:Zn-finger nucleic acid-binding protein
MSDSVICLGCGGVVDEGEGVPADATPCDCPPPTVEVKQIACPTCGGPLRVGARACPFCHCTLATTRCAHCTAWNISQAQHCQSCGRPLSGAAAATAAARSGGVCPRCSQRLAPRQYGELDVDECDGCGGLMVTPTMMDRIVAARDASSNLRLSLPERTFNREAEVRYLRCPGCDKTMNRRAFGRISGVIVDVCKDHGVWFDAGELAEVLAFIERGGLERARERETEELKQAARNARYEQTRASLGPGLGQSSALESQRFGAGRSFAATEFIKALASLWG